MGSTSIKLNKKPSKKKVSLKISTFYKIKDRTIKKTVTSNFGGNNSGIGFSLLVNYGL